MLRDRTKFDIVRFAPAALALREPAEAATDPGPGVLFGHFSVFNRWYEIDSMWEGNFLEQVAPGTFTQTFREDAQQCQISHGRSQVGDWPIGSAADGCPREDKTGAYYEVDLFDGVPELALAGIRAGLWGSSFRMRILEETVNAEPGESDHNPKGLPEVTIQRVRCPEYGPCPMGASPFATASLRSTDDYYEALRSADPEAFERARSAAGIDLTGQPDARSAGGGGGNTPTDPDRGRFNLARLARAGIPLEGNHR